MRKRGRRLHHVFWITWVLLSAQGCSLGGLGAVVVKNCELPNDQLGTLSGKWRAQPIPLAFHQGDFNSSEISDIVNAASTWNKFYQISTGIQIFDYGNPSSPRTSAAGKPSALCGSGIVSGKSYSGAVVIYKQGVWPYPDRPNVIAVTGFCTTPAKPLPLMYMAAMEVNYQNFFVQGTKLPDLQSIFLHELGHLAGLNHSCEPSSKTGFPNCNSPNMDPNYFFASMFPVFSFDSSGYGEQKRQLNMNDEGRANCLYQ